MYMFSIFLWQLLSPKKHCIQQQTKLSLSTGVNTACGNEFMW